jgi:DNA-binding NtrC family response regulator
METQVLLVDHNAARCNERRDDLVAAGVEAISAFEEYQAAEALKCNRVDVVCIDSQFVINGGSRIGPLIEGLKPVVPVVLIVDEGHIPHHFQEYVDIVIDRADFDITGTRLLQQLHRGQVTFFQRWFGDWVNRASQSRRGEATSNIN